MFLTSVLGQINNQATRQNSIQIQYNYCYAFDYTGPYFSQGYFTKGFNGGFSFDAIQSNKFHFNWNLNLKWFDNYGEGYTYGIPGVNPTDYFGFSTGPSYYFGSKHQFEYSTFFGPGIEIDEWHKNKRLVMEISQQLGYRFVSDFGLTVKCGAGSLFGRNGFWSPFYYGYFGLGYSFNKNLSDSQIIERKKGYFALTFNPFLVNVSGSLVGASLVFDHILANGKVLDAGYSISARIGIPFGDDVQFSFGPSLVLLTGKETKQFELNIGPNFPFGSEGFPGPPWYNLVNFGIGYRWTSPNGKQVFRIGSSNTGILQIGIGGKL